MAREQLLMYLKHSEQAKAFAFHKKPKFPETAQDYDFSQKRYDHQDASL